MHAAQLGIPISILFINNGIYGMTGGQMAPTTLLGMKSSTTPFGRSRTEGMPLKVAELMASLDGPVYVERTALFDPKNRNRTKKAIKKGLEIQMEEKGFSFVEVLSECPIHWGITPTEAADWVRDHVVPTYPLGVLKDTGQEPWFDPPKPKFDPAKTIEVLGAETEKPPTFARGFL
jgi:pyruvate/2-oxoacid:ferredoxin oxidoreductase beta subunit